MHQIYIVNAGSGFKLIWNTAKSFLDSRTIAKIHVLGNKFQNKLLEVIDSNQLPDFLGGTYKCPNEGGCLRSNKGPWSDPELMKLVHFGEAINRRKTTSFSYGDDLEANWFASKVRSNEIVSDVMQPVPPQDEISGPLLDESQVESIVDEIKQVITASSSRK
ncbi:unnamed protein product [Camellia sinensis]